MQQRECLSCAGVMVRDTRMTTFDYRDQSIILEQPGWYCTRCPESIVSGEDMEATEGAFLAFKAEVDGELKPDDVRKIREHLGLSQCVANACSPQPVSPAAPPRRVARIMKRDSWQRQPRGCRAPPVALH